MERTKNELGTASHIVRAQPRFKMLKRHAWYGCAAFVIPIYSGVAKRLAQTSTVTVK
jgi:hypothetical protein